MRLNIEDNGYKNHSGLLKRVVAERITLTSFDKELNIELCMDESIGPTESFVIETLDNAWKITGADTLGLYYGIGKFLHTAKWSEEDFTPNPPAGVIAPTCVYRTIYIATHFHNWYHEASIDEVKKYLEELLLWGYNGVSSIIPVVNLHSFEEPAFHEAVEKCREVFKLAKQLGMSVKFGVPANQGLLSAPKEIEADLSLFEYRGGNSGMNICPHKEGGLEYLRNLWVTLFKQFEDIGIDVISTSAYDEGGCGCEKCKPWGANGYLDLAKEYFKEAKKIYPNCKVGLSTWYFDHPIDEGEYEALWKRLKGDLSFVDFILTDGHIEYPKYPLEHEPVKPIFNFPEISMWGLMPWGGRGANPQPKRFQKMWDGTKHIISGGVPYTEGLYEDISKIQWISYYWTPDRHYRDSLAEYINYEYSGDVIDEVLEMMELIEENHVGVYEGKQPNMDACNRAEQIARSVNERLSERAKKSWRWRLLYIRAIMDKAVNQYHVDHDNGRAIKGMPSEKKIKRYGQEVILKGDAVALHTLRQTKEWYLEESEEAMQLAEELYEIYHTNRELGHQVTFPPVQGREAALSGRKFGTI